jgi:inhibitor of cysteine peptidase
MLVSLSLSACTSSQTLSLTKADAGKSIDLKHGDEIEIKLEGNITTGYAWEASDYDNTVLEMVGEEPEYKSDSSLVGAGGMFTFRFRARAAGSTTLNLIYYRSFEPDVPPIETFDVTVNVR